MNRLHDPSGRSSSARAIARPIPGASESSRRQLLTRMFWLLAATLMVYAAGLQLAHADAEAPDAFVKRISSGVLDQIKQDASLKTGNANRVSELVDTAVMPSVDFEKMTASTVGRSWRGATPDQQKKLMTEFRTLLIRTYAGALAQVGSDTTIRMKPFRGTPGDDAVVRSEVVGRGDPIELDYRLEKAGDSWKIYDLNVLGVWLVDTYRNQFAQEISAKGVDGLIQSLVDKNKAAAAPAPAKS